MDLFPNFHSGDKSDDVILNFNVGRAGGFWFFTRVDCVLGFLRRDRLIYGGIFIHWLKLVDKTFGFDVSRAVKLNLACIMCWRRDLIDYFPYGLLIA